MAFSDSDFAGCTQTFRSTSGSVMYFRGTPIVWSAKRQALVTSSTCESEYVAMFDTIKIVQSQGFSDWFGDKIPLIFVDNSSALVVAGSTLPTKKSKHMALRYHFVKEHFESLCYCPTDKNRADPFTKPLVAEKYLSIFHQDLSANQRQKFIEGDEEDEQYEAACRLCYASW